MGKIFVYSLRVQKVIFLYTDLNSHNIAIFKEHRTNYAPHTDMISVYKVSSLPL